MVLYHYTCEHGRLALGDEGRLIAPDALIDAARVARYPKWQQLLFGLIWLTDLDAPIRDALGLTSRTIDCDRTRHRYRVHDYTAAHWPSVRLDYPKRLRDGLELAQGAMPMHWWIAYTPVPVTFDPIPAAVGAS